MITLENAEKALKDVYLDVVANQLNMNANPLLGKIRQSTGDVWGKKIIKAISYGINGGIGAGTEDGTLPMASGTNYLNFQAELKNLFGKIDISDKAIRTSSTNTGAFVNLLNNEMENLIKSSSFNLGRMLYGDGSGGMAHDAPAAPILGPVHVGGDALHVAEVGHGHHHVLLLDHVVQVDILEELGDLRPPRVGVLLLDGDGLLLDDLHELVLVGEDLLELVHPDLQSRLLVVEFIALEAHQALEPHVQDGLALALGKAEALGQAGLGLLGHGTAGKRKCQRIARIPRQYPF